jgi:hypothetical protein
MGAFAEQLGLIFTMGAQPEAAQAALQSMGASADRLKDKVIGANTDIQKSALTARESARLLSEEFGLNLPRGITAGMSRIPELRDALTGLAGVAVGIFAVERVSHWVVAGADAIRGMFAEADEGIKTLDSAATEAFKHVGKEATEMLTHFTTSLAGTFNIAEIDARAAQLERYHNAYKLLMDKAGGDVRVLGTISAEAVTAIASASKEGMDSMAAVEQRIAETGQLQFDAHKRMTEVTAKEGKARAHELKRQAREAAEAATKQEKAEYHAAMVKHQANQKAYHASEEALKHQMALQNRVGREALEQAHREEEVREHAARAVQHLTEHLRREHEQEARKAEELGKETAKQIADIERIGNEETRSALRGRAETRQRIEYQRSEAVTMIQSANQQAQAIAALKGDYKAMADAAIAAYKAMGEVGGNYLKQLQDQHKTEQAASHKSILAYTQETGVLAEGAAQLIGSKKGYYAVKAAEEIAAGVECIAEGTWPPNPLALIAAGIHFESAAEWAKIAGTSAGRHGVGAVGAGGGARGYGGETYRGRAQRVGGYGGGGEDAEQAVSGAGLAPGAQGSGGGRLNVYVVGDEAAFIAERVNAADAAGHFMRVRQATRSAPAQG